MERGMNFEDFIDKNFKFLVTLLGLVLLGCAAAIITMLIISSAMKKAYVSITVAPMTAKVTIDDKEYLVGTHELASGKHKVRIEADGFQAKEFTFEAEKGHVASIETYLVHETEGLSYYEKSAEDMKILKYVDYDDESELHKFLEEFNKKREIIYSLPFDASYEDTSFNYNLFKGHIKVTIEDGTNMDACDMALCLVASGYAINQDKVLEVIREKGFDPANYKIIYNYYKEED